MKILSFIILSLSVAAQTYAQQKAVTETGEEVVLFDDKTWKYRNEEKFVAEETPVNLIQFERDSAATFLLKSTKLDVGIYLDPKTWSFKKATDNPEAEYELQLKDGDLYGILIAEKVEIPLESMKLIAVENGESVAPDLRIVKEEYRTVNDLKVLLLQMDGTMHGIEFSYYGYYFSSDNGTVQFITYTSQKLMDSYRSECEKLLNGLVLVN